MPQKLLGGCACGAIRYESNADPVIMMNCHCRDCQKASGSGYAAIVVLPKAAVQIRGELRYHKVVGQSGKATERGFCPNCGSQIAIKSERRPEALGLQAGSLDDPSTYHPSEVGEAFLRPSGLVAVIIFMPRGIVGVLEDTFKHRWGGKIAFYSAIRRPSSADQ